MKLDDRELATVLAGLRLLQAYYDQFSEGDVEVSDAVAEMLADITEEKALALTTVGIDRLCERLNVAAPGVRPFIFHRIWISTGGSYVDSEYVLVEAASERDARKQGERHKDILAATEECDKGDGSVTTADFVISADGSEPEPMPKFVYVRCYIDDSGENPPAFLHKIIEAVDESEAYHIGLCRSPELDADAPEYESMSTNDYVVEIPQGVQQ